MSRRPIFDPTVAAASRALSTHFFEYVPDRRFSGAAHLVEVWMKLEALCATARSALGPQLDAMELGFVDVGAWKPVGYEPLDDLIHCREIVRDALQTSLSDDSPLSRPRAMWQAWWAHRVQALPYTEVGAAVASWGFPGRVVTSDVSMRRWVLAVDAVIEGLLFNRRLLIRNAIREV
jgi:hypothetical protein